MKAIVFHRYGSPDVLELKEIDAAVVGDDQVLVGVQAASANPVDWHRMRGLPNFMRASEGLAEPYRVRRAIARAPDTIDNGRITERRIPLSQATSPP